MKETIKKEIREISYWLLGLSCLGLIVGLPVFCSIKWEQYHSENLAGNIENLPDGCYWADSAYLGTASDGTIQLKYGAPLYKYNSLSTHDVEICWAKSVRGDYYTIQRAYNSVEFVDKDGGVKRVKAVFPNQ